MTRGRKPSVEVKIQEDFVRRPDSTRYSTAEKQAILERLFTEDNVSLIARETGVHKQTLRTWKQRALKNGPPIKNEKTIVGELERVVFHLLATLPETSEIRTPALAITIGTLIDKYILLSGGATSRSEKIISGLSDDDLMRRLAEAKATLELPVTVDEQPTKQAENSDKK